VINGDLHIACNEIAKSPGLSNALAASPVYRSASPNGKDQPTL
jgi:hypothetical protein